MRMKTFADFEKANGRFVVCDFVCPPKKQEKILNPILLFGGTISSGRFEDTNKIFQKPESVDFHVTEWNETNHIEIAEKLLKNV
ncbi:MAG: hypothetical protein Ct9H90mP20_6800 [Candidatus Neomarinimicrobiota bacterium]|nr:MAG: hypothetical protein Ct9H90mP20_6800 [Candidatus Neomarinimicrobiota bacterium]